MESNPDLPAPLSKRGFFAGGKSSSKASPLGSSGRPIVIFFGALFFGAELDELEGGGNEKVDFLVLVRAGSEVDGVGAATSVSLALSLSLP